MSNKKTALLILIMFVFCFAASLRADSIWARRNQNKKDLYADDKARHIGDVLTINISEESTVDNKAKRTLSKETNRNTNFKGNVGLEHILPEVPSLHLGGGTTYSNTLDGKADYKDEREFTDSISVIIIDIMPNAFDNTIKSEQVANFSIVSRNKGVAAPYTKPNWLGKIFDVIWPF